MLGELSGAIKAFIDDLRAVQLEDRVTILCFSEFGRRVDENGSAGTDHGTAGPVFLVGKNIRGGMHGEYSSLLDLDDGGLKVKTDFRQIYSTVLNEWLGVNPKPAIQKELQSLPLFA